MSYVRVCLFALFSTVLLASAEAATATWDRNPESFVTGYQLSYGTQSGVHTVTINVGNVTSYQFFPPAGQRYYVVVQARTSAGLLGPKSAEVILDLRTTSNVAPTLQQPANQSSVRNTSVSLTLIGSDPNGTPVTFSASGLPPGLSINANSGVISGTVTTTGTYTVTARVSDGSLSATRTFTWTVTAPTTNQAPTLQQPPNQTSARNTAVSLTLIGSDPNGTAVTYSASGLPPGLSVNANSGVISGTVTTTGTYNVTARVSDGSLTASRTFTWTVTSSTSSTVTVTLSPADTTLSVDGNSNYATNSRLIVMTWPAQKVGMAPLLKFDLSQIPSTATIQSATLQMWMISDDGNSDQNYTVTLHQVLNRNPVIARANGKTYDGSRTWSANACCYTNIPMAQSDISPARASTVVNRTKGAKTWNALDIVRAWHASPTTNYGMLLNADKSKGANRFRDFGSVENANASQRPSLRITYSVPSGATTMAATTSASTTSATTMAMRTAEGDAEPELEMTVDPLDELIARVAETGDQPTRGDFDADGVSDVATFRSATGEWRTWLSSRNYAEASVPVVWGTQGDLQVAADYDGDRKTDYAIYRPSTGMWHVMLSSTNGVTTFDIRWGNDKDQPVAFDYDRDGRADLALPRNDAYEVLLSGSNYKKRVTVQKQ